MLRLTILHQKLKLKLVNQRGGVIGHQIASGPAILQLIREYIKLKFLKDNDKLIDGFNSTKFFNVNNLNNDQGLVRIIKKTIYELFY